jgi:small basic protein
MQLSRAQTAPIVAGIILAAAIALYLMGHPLICKCGYVKLWHFDVMSAENSQHLIDWYTPSHIIHGFLFYWLLWLVSRWLPMSFGLRLVLAAAIEAGWEVIENTDFVINHYREMTISLDYYGDSVINSVMDILFTIVGFFLAAWWPVWLTVAVAIALEMIVGAMIRDNLTLNVLMFVWPLDSVVEWQQGR